MITDPNILKSLNPPRAVYSVIGNLCKDPQLLRDPEIFLTEKDFVQEFHKIVFSAIYNLAFSSAETTKINEIDIDNYLASYPKLYKIWEKHNGIEYIRESIKYANKDTFKANYERLKKFALLRNYVENGIDVSDLYNYKSLDLVEQDKGMKKIDKMSIDEIIEHYSLKMLKIKDEFNVGQESKRFKAGDDLDVLLENLDKEPEYGYPFRNGFYNTIFRGMRRSKFMLRSADTGTGKTRQALADICNVSCDMIYDYDRGWIDNNGSYPSLFISTELEKQELQTTMLAFITGVNEDVIKNGRYSEKILNRLNKGIEVLQRAPIYCEYIDDFSITDIEMIIERYIIEHNVMYVAFDYIQLTPKLARSMAKAFGSSLREDQILVQFSAALKSLANKYNIYITSSTQLNRNSKEIDNRDATSLRGGSATADKADMGVITFRATKKDHDNLKHILERGFWRKPNYSHWVYKNRGGKISKCVIWTVMDLGTMREIPLFVTDTDFNLITDIQEIQIEYDEKAEQKEIKKYDNEYNSYNSYISEENKELVDNIVF